MQKVIQSMKDTGKVRLGMGDSPFKTAAGDSVANDMKDSGKVRLGMGDSPFKALCQA